MNVRIAKKRAVGREGRMRRFARSAISPRAWVHALRLLNYFNYTQPLELREATLGADLHIAPTASFSNGRNIVLGDRVRIGANATIWAGHENAKITIGPDSMIGPNVSMSAANYRFNDGAPIHTQAMDEADIVIGADVWIGFGATIHAGARIGDGAVIGAGSVVRGDVPPAAVVAPETARVVGTRVLRSSSGKPATPLATGGADPAVLDFLRRETERFGAEALVLPIESCGLDSFDLITLRTSVETTFGVSIPDESWAGLASLEDIAALPCFSVSAPQAASGTPASKMAVGPAREATASPGRSTRRLPIEMPQMALSGLAEPWLFKELGDIHWAMITRFLRTPSSAIKDELGDRLYATFTRIRLDAAPHLRGFLENDDLSIDSTLRRYGASLYFADHAIKSPNASASATTMSTFAKYGERGNNTTLMKGAPLLPAPDEIEVLSTPPEFAAEYRRRRSEQRTEELFRCEYEVLPPHDINGVGLIYFAAYPSIFDLCIERAEGKGFLRSHSTVSKDICYLANAEPDEVLVFRMHERTTGEDGSVRHVASLCRASDGVRMGEVESVKRAI